MPPLPLAKDSIRLKELLHRGSDLHGVGLRAEPIVISVPTVAKGRYYAVQFIDGNTYNYGYIGSRATGNEPGNYLVVGPDWKGEAPAGIKKVFSSTTPLRSRFSGRGSSTLLTWGT